MEDLIRSIDNLAVQMKNNTEEMRNVIKAWGAADFAGLKALLEHIGGDIEFTNKLLELMVMQTDEAIHNSRRAKVELEKGLEQVTKLAEGTPLEDFIKAARSPMKAEELAELVGKHVKGLPLGDLLNRRQRKMEEAKARRTTPGG